MEAFAAMHCPSFSQQPFGFAPVCGRLLGVFLGGLDPVQGILFDMIVLMKHI